MTYTRQFDGTLDSESPWTNVTDEPPAGWRPFSSESPWNTPIGASPSVEADSAAVVAHLNGLGGPADRYIGGAGVEGEDFDHPLYFVKDEDPTVRIKHRPGGFHPAVFYSPRTGIPAHMRRAGPPHDRVVRMPANAAPANGSDGHIILATANHALDAWQAGPDWYSGWPHSGPSGDDEYGISPGGMYPLDGLGVMDGSADHHGMGATASGVPLIAGRIRLVDLVAGEIPHALAMIVKWSRHNEFVSPAVGCATPDSTTVAGDADDLLWPKTGARFQLNYTEAEINALVVPAWKKTILHAMRVYGMIVIDTGGASWNLQVESGAVDVANGQPDRWRAFAAAQGWALSGDASSPYIMPLATGVDWTKLRVISPPA